MTKSLERVAEDVLSLPRESRAFLAQRLLESLDEEEDFSKKRCREIDDAVVTCLPAEQVFDELEKEVAQCRSNSTR